MADDYLSVFVLNNFEDSSMNKNLEDISAFILIDIGYNSYGLKGFLNPKPIYPFDIKLLPDIWFRQLTKIENVHGEWICATGKSSKQTFETFPLKKCN